MRGRKKWEDFSRVGGGSPKFFGPAGRRGVLSAPTVLDKNRLPKKIYKKKFWVCVKSNKTMLIFVAWKICCRLVAYGISLVRACDYIDNCSKFLKFKIYDPRQHTAWDFLFGVIAKTVYAWDWKSWDSGSIPDDSTNMGAESCSDTAARL